MRLRELAFPGQVVGDAREAERRMP